LDTGKTFAYFAKAFEFVSFMEVALLFSNIAGYRNI
jgi:hypothetical protein